MYCGSETECSCQEEKCFLQRASSVLMRAIYGMSVAEMKLIKA